MKKVDISKINTQKALNQTEEREFKKKLATFITNEQLIGFLNIMLGSIEDVDEKLWFLYYAKKLLPYIDRTPNPEHYSAFEDEYLNDQRNFDPIKWIMNEAEFLVNIKSLRSIKSQDENVHWAKAEFGKQLLTRDGVMELLGLSRTTLNRRISDGMPYSQKGKSKYFDFEEVKEWLKKEVA